MEFDRIRTVAELQSSATESPQEKAIIEQQAVAKLAAALEREGLTMPRFSALYQTIEKNDGLKARVVKWIEVEQGKS